MFFPDCREIFTTPSEKQVISSFFNLEKNTFIHQTYEEYFTSYYYVCAVSQPHFKLSDAVEVFSNSYTNPYADFISDGLLACCADNKVLSRIIERFCLVYYFSMFPLSKHITTQYQNYFLKSVSIKRVSPKAVRKLNRQNLLYLKYEVTFRMGRLQSSKPAEFLSFVYHNDNLMKYSNYHYTKFENAILKRQCAIGASFLCESDIEMDYVKRILNYRKEYDEIYDLVNRSHTLIYYHDVLDTNILIFQDDGKCKWDNARSKRIDRLKKQPTEYSMKDRISCFRLFDIATLYSFLVSHIGDILSPNEIEIIRNTVITGINKMPEDREALMIEIKQHIEQLICE